MARVLVLYYSAYGHIETMGYAVAEGCKIGRPPKWSSSAFRNSCRRTWRRLSHFKLDSPAPVATVEELADYDAIIFGRGHPLRNRRFAIAQLIDQTGGLWAKGKLVGKVGSAFTLVGRPSTAARNRRFSASSPR